MSTTTTKKEADPLKRLAAAEVALEKAQAAVQEAGRVQTEKVERLKVLLEERAKAVYDEPELVDPFNQPVSPDSVVAKLDAEIAKLGAPEAELRITHAREIERASQQRVDSLIREYGSKIEEARRDEGDELLAEFETKLVDLIAAVDRLHNYGLRSMGLAHVRQIDTRRIPIQDVSNIRGTLEEIMANPPRIPRLEGEE